MSFWVYILCSQRNGTLYTGVTSNIHQRIYCHRQKTHKGFTRRYNVLKLVYAEEYPAAMTAICREKQLKWWRRSWKIQLIESANPLWKDLYST